MIQYHPELKDILPKGQTSSQVLTALKKRVLLSNGGLTALDRGRLVKEAFPALAADTVRLAEEAFKGLLVLPGTGPGLHFIGVPPKWTENPVDDNEYTFHLNRMHHWKTMCEAYSLTGDLKYAKKVTEEMAHWIDTVGCPPIADETGSYLPMNFDGLTPWRALEAGIRGYRTWPFVAELLIDTPCFDEAFLEKLLPCVYLHSLVLREISPKLWPEADHNHYLMENLGLLSFACLFPELKGSEDSLTHAQKELDRCIEAQCTPCGGQIEGCPSYHNGCVFWFAMRNVFSQKYGLTVPDLYTEKLQKMFIHSVHATRACGGNFPWGDSHTADKETMSLAAVSCYMAFGDRDYLAIAYHFYPASTVFSDIRDNLWRIPHISSLKKDLNWAENHPREPALPLIAWQKDLNQVYLRSGWDKNAVSLMTACRTPVQNLHAHMDPGGFDFTAFGSPLISDPGIYTYKNDENRYHFKSAACHNCLTINGKDPWEYKGSWDYGPQKEGRILSVTEAADFTCITSRHENYFPAAAVRHLLLLKNRFLIVADHVTGLKKEDQVEITYHLNRTELLTPDSQFLLSLDADCPSIGLYASAVPVSMEVANGKISPVSDVWQDSKLVRYHLKPDEYGECWFAVLAVPYALPPMNANQGPEDIKKTTYINHTKIRDHLTLDGMAQGLVFRFSVNRNQLKKEEVQNVSHSR